MTDIGNLDDMRAIYDRMATSGRRITQQVGRAGVVQSARDRQNAALDQLRDLEADRISRRARLNMLRTAIDTLAGIGQALGPPVEALAPVVQAVGGPGVGSVVGPAVPFTYRASAHGAAECFCLEPVLDGQLVVQCPNPVRAHTMHADCIANWRRSQRTRWLVPCPMCRTLMQRKNAVV